MSKETKYLCWAALAIVAYVVWEKNRTPGPSMKGQASYPAQTPANSTTLGGAPYGPVTNTAALTN